MTVSIKKQEIEDAEKIYLDKVLWGYTKYTPKVYAQIIYNDLGFEIKFTVHESEPLTEKTQHCDNIHEDSCVEFFANFDPEHSNKYMNFEVNANGIMKAAIRTDRQNFNFLSLEDIADLNIETMIEEESWSVSYKIKTSLLQKFYPEFDIKKSRYIKANLYKCGEKTKIKHYLSLYELKCENPDFHRPEYFGIINLI